MATNKNIQESLNKNNISNNSEASKLDNSNSSSEAFMLSAGSALKQAREAQKISLEEICKKILINKQILTKLENDDYSGIAAPVYARGYLLAYARFLKLSEESILKSFAESEWYKRNVSRKMSVLHASKTPTTAAAADSANTKSSHWIIYTCVAILLLGVFFIWQKSHDNVVQQVNTIAIPQQAASQTQPASTTAKPLTLPTNSSTTTSNNSPNNTTEDF